jgi:hypothetical protein
VSADAAADRPADADRPLPASSSLPADGTVNVTAALSGAESPPGRSPATPRQIRPDPAPELEPAKTPPQSAGTTSDGRDAVSAAEAPEAGRSGSVGETAADATATGSGRDEAEARPESRRWRHPRSAAPGGPVRLLLGRLLGWARTHLLEAVAIVLMGIGGPIFPPVFLIGGTLALASELWDGRDKWVGLALPIVLTVIGLAVGVAAGGRAHWMHESWVYLDVVSRVAPALGAGYLAWRCQRPRRPASLPPFHRPYRTS